MRIRGGCPQGDP
uniref:Uncharacterized protein n=1 Tax=Arundo donax TaxID=35708 RepID=A0A0A8YBF0_ARUDO